MKYKLKKDLPFAKAGTEVRKDDYLNSDSQTCFACGVYQFWVKKKVMDEWIEEIKPREFWITLKDNEPRLAIGFRPSADYDGDFIKVREVIE